MPDKEEKDRGPKERFIVFVNNVEFTTDEHVLTGSQIKELASVPAEYELFQVQGDHTVPVGNDESVHIHNRMHFRAIPPGNFGVNAAAA